MHPSFAQYFLNHLSTLWRVHILNSHHTISTIPMRNFLTLKLNIGPTLIISVTIITPVKVVIAIVVAISNILTLWVVIPIVSTLISFTLASIFLIGALGVWPKTVRLLIHYIRIFSIVVLINRWWWFSQIVHHIYLFCAPGDIFSHRPKINSHLSHLFTNLICSWVV